VLVIQW